MECGPHSTAQQDIAKLGSFAAGKASGQPANLGSGPKPNGPLTRLYHGGDVDVSGEGLPAIPGCHRTVFDAKTGHSLATKALAGSSLPRRSRSTSHLSFGPAGGAPASDHPLRSRSACHLNFGPPDRPHPLQGAAAHEKEKCRLGPSRTPSPLISLSRSASGLGTGVGVLSNDDGTEGPRHAGKPHFKNDLRMTFSSNSDSFQELRGRRFKNAVAVMSWEEDVRGAVSWVFQLLGCHRVETFTNASEASLMDISRDPVDLVLCELELADTVLCGLRKLGMENAPVVVMCEKRFDREMLSAALDGGAKDYITKPVRIQSIRGMASKYLVNGTNSEDNVEKEVEQGTKYEKVKNIGSGAFGQVSLVKRRRDGKCFAMKDVPIGRLMFHEQRRVLNELRLHRSFDCPCIVRYFSSWMKEKSAFLLMEYVEAGPLSLEVERCRANGTQIPDQSILYWGGQMLIGLLYLHQKAVIHRDLKLDNVLGPDSQDNVKLADFGISKQIGMEMSMVGTPLILAPERCPAAGEAGNDGRAQYGIASDYWSFGVILYELAMLHGPFEATKEKGQENQKNQNIFSRIVNQEAPPLKFSRSAPLHRIITGGLLQKNAEDRPKSTDLMSDPAISKEIHRYLRRNGLTNNPSILEVVVILPAHASGVSHRVECSELDAVKMHTQWESRSRMHWDSPDSCFPGPGPRKLQLQKKQSGSDLAPLPEHKTVTSASVREIGSDEHKSLLELPQEILEEIKKNGSEHASSSSQHRDVNDLEDMYKDLKNQNRDLEEQLDLAASKAQGLIVDQETTDKECAYFRAKAEAAQRWGEVVVAYAQRQLHHWPLRFVDTIREAEYLSSYTVTLHRRTSWCCFALALLCSFTITALELDIYAPPSQQEHTVALASLIAMSLSTLLMLGLLACTGRGWGMPPIWVLNLREYCAAGTVVMAMVFVIAAGPITAFPDMDNERPLIGLEALSFDVVTLLWVALILGLSRKLLQIRSPLQAIIHTIAFSLCAAVQFKDTGFSSGAAWVQTALLGGFLFVTLIDCRAGEKGHRLRFLILSRSGELDRPKREHRMRSTVPKSASNLSLGSSMAQAWRSRARSASTMSIGVGNIFGKSWHRAESTASLASKMSTNSEALFNAFEMADDAISRTTSLESIAAHGQKENWILDHSAVKIMDKCLGSGGFGQILEGELYGTPVALKVSKALDIETPARRTRTSTTLGNELRVLRHVWHPSIVMFFGSCIDPGSGDIILVLELLKGDQLDEFVGANPTPPGTVERHKLLLDICSALSYLHRQKPCIVHGDLKGSNIFVESWLSGPRAKLLDFGLSRLLTKNVTPLGGTVNWMAPEVIKNRSEAPAASADVFSFGRLAYMVVTSKRPLCDMTANDIIHSAREAVVPDLAWPSEDRVPLCAECKELADGCLALQALARPSMDELLEQLKYWLPEGNACDLLQGGYSDMLESWEEGVASVHQRLQSKQNRIFTYGARLTRSLSKITFLNENPVRELLEGIVLAARKHKRFVEMSRVELIPEAILSNSSFGVVVVARLDGAPVIVRVPRAHIHSSAVTQASLILHELQELMQVKHPNIIAFHGLCFEPTDEAVAPVLEWVEGVPLNSFMQEPVVVPNVSTRFRLLQDICSALRYLHERQDPLALGDLAPSKVLVESRMSGYRAKVIDYGWSRLLRWLAIPRSGRGFGAAGKSKQARKQCLVWGAPETLQRKCLEASTAMDVFSFGRLIYLVILGCEPLDKCDIKTMEKAAKAHVVLPLDWPANNPVAAKCRPLCERCQNQNPGLRPEITSVQEKLKTLMIDSTGARPQAPGSTFSGTPKEESFSVPMQITGPKPSVAPSEVEAMDFACPLEHDEPESPKHVGIRTKK